MTDIQSGSDEAIVAAASGLFAMGEYGVPAGAYLLKGGQAAFRLGRLADSAVLLFQGLKVVEPQTLTWVSLLVTRAVVCAHYGLYGDAIAAGHEFLGSVHAFPQAEAWIPHAHHALGLAYDRRHEYDKAVPHHRASVESYAEHSIGRAIAMSDLAYSLAKSGQVAEADFVLAQVPAAEHERAQFVLHCTTALVRFLQGRYSDALAHSELAEPLAVGKGTTWELPLAELRYWTARAKWAAGDGCNASLKALWAAVVAQKHWHFSLCDDATSLLAEIRAKGGI